MRVLVVYASADGSTAEIARRIAQRLRERGHEVSDQSAGAAGSLDGVLLVAVWHGLYNFVSGTQAATGMVAVVVSTLVMIQGVLLIILEVRARRQGRPSVLGPAS